VILNLGIWLALMPLMVVQGWRKQLLSCFKHVHSDAE